jgi:mannose-6-phosphate isomerase
MPWGGPVLARHYNRETARDKIGEAWLLSQHALHDSVVQHGPFAGQTLGQLITEHSSAILGTKSLEAFPLLVKILHARETLSVQVHPDDEQAKRYSPTERGKSEAWTILETESEGLLYLGLKQGTTIDEWCRAHATLDIPQTLNLIHPQGGQTYAIPPGTIHALGAGVTVLEVQQSSDATYRLYDWGRGRELHIEQGLACLAERPEAGLQQPRQTGDGGEVLVTTPFFTLSRYLKPGEVKVHTPAIVVPWNGEITLTGITVPHGQAALCPANVKDAAFSVHSGTIVFVIHWH